MKMPKLLRVPLLAILIVAATWALAVSRPIENFVKSSDALGCVGPHLTQYLFLMAAGMATGLAFGPLVERSADPVATAIMPTFSQRRRQQVLKAGAILLVVAGMVLIVPWLNSRVDQFVAVHNVLRAEIDLVVFLMGGLSGAAWVVIWRRYAWVGATLSILMLLMMLTNTLSRHAWC